MRTAKISETQSDKEKMKNTTEEQNFDLSLQTLVTGSDAAGNDFKEKTELCTISSQVASFWLKTKVKAGSLLNLSLDIPKTFVLENSLYLNVSGKVATIKPAPNKNSKQLISIQLNKAFKINPSSR